MSEPVINSEMAPMEQLIRTVVNAAKNGGITASGGEPMYQIDFLTELFKRLKEENDGKR